MLHDSLNQIDDLVLTDELLVLKGLTSIKTSLQCVGQVFDVFLHVKSHLVHDFSFQSLQNAGERISQVGQVIRFFTGRNRDLSDDLARLVCRGLLAISLVDKYAQVILATLDLFFDLLVLDTIAD